LPPQILEEKHCARISRGGNSPIFYLPKKFFEPGDEVECQIIIHNGKVELVLTKRIYSFTIEDIRNLAAGSFSVEYDKNIAGIRVFNAIHDSISLSYTESIDENLKPARITVSRRFDRVRSREDYSFLLNLIKELKHKEFDAYLEPEGDLDSMNVYRSPRNYELKDEFDAVETLGKTGKQLGFSVIIRFDNEKNNIGQVKAALREL